MDPPMWRHSKYSYWIDFTDFDSFDEAYSHIKLKPGEMKEDEHYVYRRMKSGSRVERKAKVDYNGHGWVEKMEKADHSTFGGASSMHDFRGHWFRYSKLEDFIDAVSVGEGGQAR